MAPSEGAMRCFCYDERVRSRRIFHGKSMMKPVGSESRVPRAARSSLRSGHLWRALCNAACVVGPVLIASQAQAQVETSADPPTQAPGDATASASASAAPEETSDDAGGEGVELTEVVVTVDRRKKDLQRYSGTASAFT